MHLPAEETRWWLTLVCLVFLLCVWSVVDTIFRSIPAQPAMIPRARHDTSTAVDIPGGSTRVAFDFLACWTDNSTVL